MTAGQRRHDALIDIAHHYLDHCDDLATVSGARPHLQLRVDVGTLQAKPGAAMGQLDWAGAICGATARRLACDASLVRVVMAGESMPLDVGRATETVPVAMRRAVIARDRTCVFEGCDRHARYCDAHHVQHWADGGPTSLDNLALLCRYHHRLVHEGGWQVGRAPDGTWTTHRPGDPRPAPQPAHAPALAEEQRAIYHAGTPPSRPRCRPAPVGLAGWPRTSTPASTATTRSRIC